MYIKKSITAFMALGMATILSSGTMNTARAVDEDIVAAIDVVSAIILTENAAMNFGKVAKPTAGTNVITVDTADTRAPIAGGGDGALVSGGTITSADVTIAASSGATISIEADQSLGQTGLSIGNFRGKYGSEAVDDIDGGDGYTVAAVGASQTLKIGADMTIDSTAVDGVNNLEFTLTVIYQ